MNADLRIDLTDAIGSLFYLFGGAFSPVCPKSADTNDDGAIDISDPIGLLQYLFLGDIAPRYPFPGCGPDLTDDPLPCEETAGCPRP